MKNCSVDIPIEAVAFAFSGQRNFASCSLITFISGLETDDTMTRIVSELSTIAEEITHPSTHRASSQPQKSPAPPPRNTYGADGFQATAKANSLKLLGGQSSAISSFARGLLDVEGGFKQAASGPEKTLENLWNRAQLYLGPIPNEIEDRFSEMLESPHQALLYAKSLSNAQLAQMSDAELAKLADSLAPDDAWLHPTVLLGTDASLRSQQLYRVLTAHGTDQAKLEGLLGRMRHAGEAVKDLHREDKTRFQAMLDSDPPVPGDWNNFQQYLDRATGSHQSPGTKVEPLIDGSAAFPAMLDAIDHAQSSVNVTTFAFQSDDAGWEYAKHLAAAADRGCDVKVIYDPIGSETSDNQPTDPKIYDFLRSHHVQVIPYSDGALGSRVTHRKITVVDGKTGFTGGMNIGNEYRDIWHDVHAKVTGPGVRDLQKLFVDQWKRQGGTITASEERSLFPTLDPQPGGGGARVIGHEGMEDKNIKLAYLRAIDTASKSIHIASPYFSDPDVINHLCQAAKHGVEVTVVLPQTNNYAIEQELERSYYNQLSSAGVKIYEYHGRPMAHEKVATFDGRVSTIGSSNLDARSLNNTDEDNLWMDDPAVARQLDSTLFGSDLNESTRVTGYKPGLFCSFYDILLRAVEKLL